MSKKFIALSLISFSLLNAETMYNMCKDALVQKEKTNYSQIIKVLKRGEKVNVLEKNDYYITSFHEENDDSDMPGGLAVWAKLDNGYVSYKCLVSSESNKKIEEGKVRKGSKKDTKIAKKGFSEAEDGDSVAMRGAAGKAKFGKANYSEFEFITSLYTEDAKEKYKMFRKDGKIGEYK